MHLERCIPDVLVGIGGVFVGMDGELGFTMDTPVHIFLIELFEFYYMRPGWRNCE